MSWDNFETSEDTGRASEFLDVEGIYALQIDEALPDKMANGELREGCLGLKTTVVGAATEACVGKGFGTSIFGPVTGDSDKAHEFKKRRLTALFIAASIMSPDELGKKINLGARLSQLKGKVVVMKLVKNENGYLEINFSDIWHVDDPKAAGKHLTDKALKLVGKESRREASYFEKCRKDPHAGGSMKSKPANDLFKDL
jgi:hypothetical protein